MPKRKVDRRIARTKQLLRDALMDLIVERGYDGITVQDITDHANVARTTFYLHYKDKDELLFEGMRDIYDQLFDSIFEDPTRPRGADAILTSMTDATDYVHVAEYSDFYTVMLGEKGSASFIMRVWQYLAESLHKRMIEEIIADTKTKPHMPIEALAYYLAGAQIGLIKWWLMQEKRVPAQQMAMMCERTMVNGLQWALGINLE
jgi:AcrR family transcriptional regulator